MTTTIEEIINSLEVADDSMRDVEEVLGFLPLKELQNFSLASTVDLDHCISQAQELRNYLERIIRRLKGELER